MREWAQREIDIAKDRDRKIEEATDTEWDYSCAIYDSALKAFESLLDDEHSGFSIKLTKHVLNSLIDGRPLSPIVDTKDIWTKIRTIEGENKTEVFQCKRMSSLFKRVNSTSTAFTDLDRIIGIDIHSLDSYSSAFLRSLIEEIYPITMPYTPPAEPIKVYCESFLTDEKNGDLDTRGVLYAVTGTGHKKDIYKYFKSDDSEHGWKEISEKEYNQRKTNKIFEGEN